MDDTTAANRGAHDNIISHGTLSTGSYIHTHWHEIVHNLDFCSPTRKYISSLHSRFSRDKMSQASHPTFCSHTGETGNEATTVPLCSVSTHQGHNA